MTDALSTAADLDLALAAVRHAGTIAMRHFGRLTSVDYKRDDQPVTAADLEIDRMLRQALLAARADYGWLSEETADSAARLERSRVWVVDPIDGTNSFVEGIPEFVVSLGLVEEGRPVLGVVHNPATGELFHAVRGGGAFRDGEPIRVAPVPEGEPWRLLASRSELARGELGAFRPPAWSVHPLGSTAYRMVKVADGTGHAFTSRGYKQEWDVCAAHLVVEEAGGIAVRGDGGRIVYNRPTPRFRGLIVSRGADLPHPLNAAIA